MSAFSPDNPAFAALIKYGGVLMAKTVLMSPLTGLTRYLKGAVASREDAVGLVGNDEDKIKRLMGKDAYVERIRAAHLNDLENILPFFIIAMMYIATNPDAATATLLFKVFTVARYVHTIAYVGKVPQPARGVGFIAGLIINLYMIVQLIKYSF